jgi:hypothetical protein
MTRPAIVFWIPPDYHTIATHKETRAAQTPGTQPGTRSVRLEADLPAQFRRSAAARACWAAAGTSASEIASAFYFGATIFVTRPTLVSPAYRLSCLSMAQ